MTINIAATLTIASATVAANGTTLTVQIAGYSGTTTPASPTGFFVYVNGIFNQVTAASQNASGTNTLTLAEPIRSGQTVRLRYDFTSVAGTQISDGATPANTLYYIDQYVVTNNSTVTSNLTLTTPVVGVAGNTITFVISGGTGTINIGAPLQNGYTPYGFKIIIGSSPGAINSVLSAALVTTTLTLTLQNTINSGDTVKYLYDYRGGAQIWDSAGTINSLGNVTTATAVTNSSTVTAQYYLDHFNDTNGSALTAHTPDTGAAWTTAGTSFNIRNGAQSGTAETHFTSNASSPGVASNIMFAGTDPSYANYRITGDIYLRTLLNSASTYYLRTNSSGNTGYSLSFNPNTKLLTVSKLSGSFPSGVVNTFSLASTTFAAGQTYSMGFECIDGFIHDSRGGSSVVSYTVGAGGSGYTTNPTVVIDGSKSGGLSASATVTRVANAVSSIALNGDGGGSGYWITPTVTFTGGGGTGATATAVLGQGRPCTILSVYWATGAGQVFTTPVLTVIDPVNPITAAGKVGISSTNDGPITGPWHANFHIDYAIHGYTPIQGQYQYNAGISDSSYPYNNFNASIGSLPALDGIPPYFYSAYRNTTLSTSGSTVVNVFGSSPSSLIYTDTAAYSPNLYYYYYVVTDATGATGQAYQQKAGQTAYPQYIGMRRDTPLNIYFIGDSITTGGFFAQSVFAILSRSKAPRTVNGINENSVSLQFASYIQGQSGSNTSQWVKGQTFYNTAVAAIISLKCTVVSIALGENDVRDGQTYDSYVTPSAYGANLSNIASNLLVDAGTGAGGVLTKVIIQYPYAAVPGSNANGNGWTTDIRSRMLEYRAQIAALDNGTTIFAGDNTSTDFFEYSTQNLTDGVHPGTVYPNIQNYSGGVWLGFLWGQAIARILYPNSITPPASITAHSTLIVRRK